MYYKFTRSKGVYQIPVREDFSSDISTYFNGDIIFSEQDEISEGNSKFVLNMDDFMLYDSYNTRLQKSNFDKTEAAKARVINLTKVGLDVFDKKNGTIISHVGVDDEVMLDLTFSNDTKGNIWASISYRTQEGWKNGYIIYKNYKNNFANVLISGFRFTTVLTNGEIDSNKVSELKGTDPQPQIAMFAATPKVTVESKSTTTTTSSKPKINKAAVITKEEKEIATYANKVAYRHPDVIQNDYNYPKKLSKTTATADGKHKFYHYDYTSKLLSSEDMDAIHEAEDRSIRTLRDNFDYQITYYNRFKKAYPDDILTKGFMHIFFSRPDLNLINSSGTGLLNQCAVDPFFQFKCRQKPDLVRQLTKNSGADHNFNMLLSNKAESFTSLDENIKYADYGKTFQNHSIMLGKGIFDSLIAGTFEVKYTDTRDLDILALHKMWIQYISNVYHGSWDPKIRYVWKKIIDYAVSVEVVVTAEDFETILYWSKYYGVFPINVPYSALSWDSGNLIIKPDFTITYGYSFREEWNPTSLIEVNMNCFKNTPQKSANYLPIFNTNYGRAGTTWVGAPFIETINDISGKGKQYGTGVIQKLRFRPGPIIY